jgi:hypothetical protein
VLVALKTLRFNTDDSIRGGLSLVPDLHQHGDNRRLLRAINQPLLRVHFKLAPETKRKVARVLDGRIGLSSHPFQFTSIVSVYIGQVNGTLASFRSEQTPEMLFQPEVYIERH